MKEKEGATGTGKQEQISRNRKSGSYEQEGTNKQEQNREHMEKVKNICALCRSRRRKEGTNKQEERTENR
jgi:hypothetical protein